MGAVSAITSIVSGVGGMVQANQAQKQAKGAMNNARNEKKRLQAELESLENSRQPIINPYANVKDTTGNLSNTYANLGVATQAAEFQAEQAEISLSNTLDTLRATGASAGGATALAQAALASKKQISASLEMQEGANQKLFAKGEEQLQRLKMAEDQRLQNADVMGKQFMFGQQDKREMQKLNRKAGQLDNATADLRQAEATYASAEANKQGALFSGITDVLSGGGDLYVNRDNLFG